MDRQAWATAVITVNLRPDASESVEVFKRFTVQALKT